MPIREIALNSRFEVGPFNVEIISVAHSIPESTRCHPHAARHGAAHRRLEDRPYAGDRRADRHQKLAGLAVEGVTAMVCDSTNAMRDGRSPSELDVAKSLARIVRREAARGGHDFCLQRRTHEGVADAARSSGRQLVVAGRAMHRMIEVAIKTGYLPPNFKYHDQEQFPYLQPDEVGALCTGSQGEHRAALARIAADEHPDIKLDRGDLVSFPRAPFPGNERAVAKSRIGSSIMGCELVTDGDALVHVTGHPRREELKEMYGWVKPRIAIPMHGEARHLAEHAKLARAAGVSEVLSVRNGDIVRLAPGKAEIIDEAPVGRIFRDGNLLVPSEDGPVRERRSLAFAGMVIVALPQSARDGVIPDPEVVLDGVPAADAEGRPMVDIVRDAVEGTIASIPRDRQKDTELVREAVRRAVRSAVDDAWGKRPIVKVLITRAAR